MAYPNQPPYTNLSVAAQIRERMMFAIESETPELAPTVRFKRLVQFYTQAPNGDDTTDGGQPAYQSIEATTDEQRWRTVYIRLGSHDRGDNVDGFDIRNYAVRMAVVVGYPMESLLKLDPEQDSANIFDVEDLIAHDLEQLNDVLNDTGIFGVFSGEAAIGGVDNVEYFGASRSGNTMTLLYLVRYSRVRV